MPKPLRCNVPYSPPLPNGEGTSVPPEGRATVPDLFTAGLLDDGHPQIVHTARLYWDTADGTTVRLYQGHVLAALRLLPKRSVHCVVTSPPYWGLRDYGTAQWEGGSAECDHIEKAVGMSERNMLGPTGHLPSTNAANVGKKLQYKSVCGRCGARRTDQQLGSEPSPDCGTHGQAQCGGCFVCSMVAVFRAVRRVLRDDGVLWLNLGDTYTGGGGYWPSAPSNQNGGSLSARQDDGSGAKPAGPKYRGLKSGNLVGVPWRVALALQADGWILRQDVIWCLSGGTWLYVRGKKGESIIQLHDLARSDEWKFKSLEQMELWNGERWTKILGISSSKRAGDEIEFVLRSGERLACTPNHKFPTKNRGLVEARNLKVGDKLVRCRLPQPYKPRNCEHMTLDAAWFAGLYLAEGCGVDDEKISLAGHVKETARWERVRRIVSAYGGTCTLREDGNKQTISVYGKLIHAVVKELVSGKDAKTKCFSANVWRYDNSFVEAMMDGYLSGDGGEWAPGMKEQGKWSLGFTRNYNLERDLRVACARLGWTLTLRPNVSKISNSDREYPSFWGELYKKRSGHWNEKDREEIVEIRKSRCREVYDVGVADEPHLFATASGILTHNSKPSPMPESCRNRCTKAHEYLFLLAKRPGYYYDAEAVKDKAKEEHFGRYRSAFYVGKKEVEGAERRRGSSNTPDMKPVLFRSNKRDVWAVNDHRSLLDWLAERSPELLAEFVGDSTNKQDVWRLSAEAYSGVHSATFPTKLVTPCVKAGTSERGCCADCGAPWRRVVAAEKLTRPRPNEYVKRTGEGGTGNSCANSVAGVEAKTLGWYPTCDCYGLEPLPKEPPAGRDYNAAKRAAGTVGEKGQSKEDRQDDDLRLAGLNLNPDYPAWLEKVSELLETVAGIETVPCTVLDPFIGSGTTVVVALELGQRCVGVDLSETYLRDNAVPRIEGYCLGRPALSVLIRRVEKPPVKLVGKTLLGKGEKEVGSRG